jgi:hypothetical protein
MLKNIGIGWVGNLLILGPMTISVSIYTLVVFVSIYVPKGKNRNYIIQMVRFQTQLCRISNLKHFKIKE